LCTVHCKQNVIIRQVVSAHRDFPLTPIRGFVAYRVNGTPADYVARGPTQGRRWTSCSREDRARPSAGVWRADVEPLAIARGRVYRAKIGVRYDCDMGND
jgi:hypothetical protein